MGVEVKNQFNWPKIGNERVIEFLNRSLEADKVAQTYIFVGPDDLGKATIALAFARNLQGNAEGFNSDLYLLKPEEDKKSLTIEQVRDFIKTLNLSSFLNSYKIGIIKEAERLTAEAQNALLKTLEEPKDKVVVILLVTSEESLPATILSRSQILYFQPVEAAVIYDYLLANYQVSRSLAKDLANLALGRPLKAIRWLENPDKYKEYLEAAQIFLTFFQLDVNDRFKNLDKLFNDRSFSKQSVQSALEILFLAEGLLRDLLLLSLNQKDRLQHSALAPELERTLANLETAAGGESAPLILSRLKLIAQAKEYLGANVNPRLVLEQLVVNL